MCRTQPNNKLTFDLPMLNDLQRQLDQVQKQLDAAKSRLDALSKLPPIQPWQFQYVPAEPAPKQPSEIKPYGHPFKFNGLTLYVEPISLNTSKR